MSARRSRHEDHEEHENHERWLITYADMITLLMVLFIVLFAIGQTDLKKFAAFRSGLGQQSTIKGNPVVPGGTGVLDRFTSIAAQLRSSEATDAQAALQEKQAKAAAAKTESDTLHAAQTAITTALSTHGLAGAVQFRTEARGLIVTIVADHVLFDTGSASLAEGGRHVLDAIAPVLAGLPNPVAIEGHTDDEPILGGPYPSNWELSTARATSVLRDLVDTQHLPANRLSAAGYADQRPLFPNDTPQHRAANRRVEVVVVSTTT